MVRKHTADLSRTDIRFLKAIQMIEDDPEQYPDTDRGQAPANTTSLKQVTDLSDDQIRYRTRPDERGLDQLGLVTLYASEPTPQGYEPRAVELTDQGRKALTNWEKKHGDLDPESLDRPTREDLELAIERVETRVDELAGTVERLDARLDALDHAEFGAIDDETAAKLDRTISLVVTYHRLFADVLGLPPEEFEDLGTDEARQRIRSQLEP